MLLFCRLYAAVMRFLHQPTDFTELEIRRLGELSDLSRMTFFRVWNINNVSNYLHILLSGHWTWAATRFRNLVRFCQEVRLRRCAESLRLRFCLTETDWLCLALISIGNLRLGGQSRRDEAHLPPQNHEGWLREERHHGHGKGLATPQRHRSRHRQGGGRSGRSEDEDAAAQGARP
ncbi:unnamed protein product [Phaeothamnion confervicola]